MPELLPWLVRTPMFHVVWDEGVQSRPVLRFQLERRLSEMLSEFKTLKES